MTNAEKQEIIEAVLAALATNSKTIAQLSPKQSLEDSDLFEVAGGSRVTYQNLRSLIREGLALESRLSDYLTEDAAMLYLAKLDTETGTVDYKESPLVMLDGFKGVNGYTPVTGDLYYENLNGYQIWIKTQGGASGEHANTHVAYVNKNDGAIYRWTGSSMVRIGGSSVINDLTTGGEGDALSAEMGKWLYTNLYTIFSQLGTYAFPNGKPQIDWGGGNPPVIPPCTVSKTIGTGLSSTGGDSDVAFGDPLEVSIAITNNLYIVDDDSVEVTMGGSPVQGAWNASTMKVTIAAVTGDVVVNVPSMTYESSNLAFHLDCKNRGGQSGHWIDLIGNKDFTLNQVQESDSGMVFDGINSTALHSGSLAVGHKTGTIEFVIEPTNGITYHSTILFNGYEEGIIAVANVSSGNLAFNGISTAYSGTNNMDKLSVELTGLPAAASLNIDNNGNRSALVDGIVGNSLIADFYYAVRPERTGKMTVGCFIENSTGNPLPIEAITIKAIRVYSSQLTLAQAQHNYKVDKKRFNLS